jgi:hypothetical protein
MLSDTAAKAIKLDWVEALLPALDRLAPRVHPRHYSDRLGGRTGHCKKLRGSRQLLYHETHRSAGVPLGSASHRRVVAEHRQAPPVPGA